MGDLFSITKEKIVIINEEITPINYKIPNLICLYRKYMGEVDRFDSGCSH